MFGVDDRGLDKVDRADPHGALPRSSAAARSGCPRSRSASASSPRRSRTSTSRSSSRRASSRARRGAGWRCLPPTTHLGLTPRRRRRPSRPPASSTPDFWAGRRTLGARTSDVRRRLRLRPAAGGASPRPRSSRATRPGCSSTVGPGAPPEHRHVRDLPELLRARRPRRGERDAGASRPGCGCAARPAVPPRCCCWSRSTTSTGDVGGPGPPGAQAARRARPLRARRRHGRGRGRRAHGRRRHVRACDSLGERRRRSAARRVGEMPLPPYITAPLADPERYQTVYADRPGSVAAPTAGLHLTPALLGASGRRAASPSAAVELVVGLDTFKPVTEHDPAEHRMHSERYRVPADDAGTAVPRAPRRVVAVGTTTVRALESRGRDRRSRAGAPTLFIRRPYPWQVVDVLLTNFHLPRTTLLMMIDAFVGPRWRELYAVGPGRRATASCPSATPCCSSGAALTAPGPRSTVDATDGAARAGVARTARGSYRTPCFMPVGHPGRGQVPERRRLRAARRRDRARQHLPPDAAARRRGRGRARRARPLHRLGRPDPHRLGRLPGLLARARRSTTTASRSAPPTTARATASRPSRPSPCRSCSAPTSRWCSTSARRCPSPPEVVRLAVERTAAWAKRARAAHQPGRPGAVRHRAGRRRRARCGPRAPRRTVDARLRRLRHRRALGGGDPGRDAAGAGRRRRPSCPPTGPAT